MKLDRLLDSCIYRELRNSDFQICFHAYPSYVFRFSFLTTLDIYKDYFKSHHKVVALIVTCILWPKTICPNLSFSWRSCCVVHQGFCNQWVYWSSSCGWTDELCNEHISQIGVLVTYWNPCIDCLVTYLELCIEMRDCHYITSPIVYWDKCSTVG